MSTVLIADDDARIRRLLHATLRGGGHDVLEAADGEQALAVVRAHRPAVAVLDVQMPQLGGLQVVKRLRELHKDDAKAVPPAILVASDLTSHLLREALTHHVFSVLSKPVNYALLLDALARVIRRHYESRWPQG